jgi:hypothetical protein
MLTPVIAAVTRPPIPVKATDGRVHMAYEPLLTNVISQPITLRSIRAQAGTRKLQELTSDLAQWFKALGVAGSGTTPVTSCTIRSPVELRAAHSGPVRSRTSAVSTPSRRRAGGERADPPWPMAGEACALWCLAIDRAIRTGELRGTVGMTDASTTRRPPVRRRPVAGRPRWSGPRCRSVTRGDGDNPRRLCFIPLSVPGIPLSV